MAAGSDLIFNPSSLTVMIVDDHDPIRKGIKRILQGMEVGDVVECFDGDDALKTLAKRPVDLLILDLYMRNVTGFDVLEHLRNRAVACDIPVIVVTGEASKEEIVKVADMGAEDYLLKPFQSQDLEKKVIKVLNKFYSPTPLLKAVRKAERHVMAEEFQEAIDAFDAALKIDPQSARAAHGKALALDKMQRGEEALHLLHQNIKLNLSYHKTYGAIADLLIKQNRVSEALDAMQRELEINPKQPNRQVQLARLLLKEGNPQGAVEHFRIALQDNAKLIGALMGMGQAYALADNLDKSLYYFKRVRRYHPTATKALEASVKVALTANDPRKAELLLKDEKSAHPDRYDTYILLARLLMKQEREDEGLAVIDDLLARDPANVSGLKIRGLALLKNGDYADALIALGSAAKSQPSAEIYTAMAEAYLALAKLPDANDCLNKAIALNSDHPQAFFLLAETHRKSSQWLKASFLYRRAAQLGADKDQCMDRAKECAQQTMLRRHRPRGAA